MSRSLGSLVAAALVAMVALSQGCDKPTERRDVSELRAAVKVMEHKFDEYKADVDEKIRVLEAERDKATEDLRRANNAVANYVGRVSAMQLRVEELSDDRAQLAGEREESRLHVQNLVFRIRRFWEKYGIGTPGVVEGLDGETVTLTLGPDGKARVGDVYLIRRDKAIVGNVVVTSVGEHKATARIDGPKGPAAPVQVGDAADPSGY